MHKGNTYVHICIQTHDLNPEQLTYGRRKPMAFIMGWTTYDELKEKGDRPKDGPWGPRNGEAAAYVFKPHMLRPIKYLDLNKVLRTDE
jgi:hypothetical protein